jgi:hypothetical protein
VDPAASPALRTTELARIDNDPPANSEALATPAIMTTLFAQEFAESPATKEIEPVRLDKDV